jgi:exopolyphosphatase / guanosine-5'-triphosphate,3'-diphosphate pyrophosphatase
LGDETGRIVAAIGVGSHSIRLLIGLAGDRHITAIERMETVTKLASYKNDKAGAPLLSDESIINTRSAVANFAQHAREQGARLVGIIATEAVRSSSNRADLLEPIETEVGLSVTVISGETEARMGWESVTGGYGRGVQLGVIDIGGASTDLSVGMSGSESPDEVASIKVGGRTATRRFKLSHPQSLSELASTIDLLGVEIGPRARGLDPQPRAAVVIGGTATVLASLRHSSQADDNSAGAVSNRDQLENWLLRIAQLKVRDRAATGIAPEYADIIVAGGVILLTILNAWQLNQFYISERNILDTYLERSLNVKSLR